MAQVSSLMLARFTRLPRRSADTWQGGVLRMPMWVDGPDGTPYRPWGGVWVSLETGLANAKLAESNEGDGTLALEALLDLGFKFARTRPAAIQVTDKALGEQIARALGDPELAVTVDPRLDEVKAMVERMAVEANGEPHPAAIDQGRWSHEVVAHGGPRRVTLAIPELLRPLEAPPEPARRGMPDRRVMERMLLEVQRFAATREFASESEMNDAIQARFGGSMDTIASTATTPVERAQDLAYRAMDARGRRRIQLARKALELSADCADAYVLLAEECTDPGQARDLYAQGVAAGERVLGPTTFDEW